ncbi:WD repeat-containing protein 74 [Anopheles marshallii]|uniref:WD repeat-containing protein 74 n=1 Tax=Anopheles marshallii TaxID=1521116 RepID=UPI00237C0408|nr:WD repeat-containing protein 74 [Anopheles marshallii]
MKYASVNAKCPSYNEKHALYVGAHTGSFKLINTHADDPFQQLNLQPIEVLNKTSKITCMEFGNAERTELLIGRANRCVKVFSCAKEESISNFEIGSADVVGLGRSNGCIVVGCADGTVQIVKYPEPVKFNVGENLSRLRLCPDDERLMVTGGKLLNQIVKLWDLETQKVLFQAKNVKKVLELEQLVWDNDVVFVNRNLIAACSRHGYVRLYDTRGPTRRPVQGFTSSDPDDQLAFSCLASHGDYLYAGTTTFGARAFDLRRMKNHIHVYKGFTGTVTSIRVDPSGNHLFTGCLDRYVRVHHAHRTALEYRCYVKSKPTQVLGIDWKEQRAANEHNAVESIADDVVHILSDQDGSDAEYDQMFSKMPTVNEPTKKRKADSDAANRKLPTKVKKIP